MKNAHTICFIYKNKYIAYICNTTHWTFLRFVFYSYISLLLRQYRNLFSRFFIDLAVTNGIHTMFS